VIVDPGWAVYPSIVFSDTEMFVAYSTNTVRVVVYDIQSILRRAGEPTTRNRH